MFRKLGNRKLRLIKRVALIICVALCFILPTVATFYLAGRMDKANEKTEAIVASAMSDGYSEPVELYQDEVLSEYTEDEAEPEQNAKLVAPLTSMAGTATDAVSKTVVSGAADASKTDADAQNASVLNDVDAISVETADASKSDNEKTVDASKSDDAETFEEPLTEEQQAAISEQERIDALKATEKNGRKVYLTFDDGPSIYTDELLEILAKYDVKATFFVVSEDRSDSDELVKIADAGHTIGLHSDSHVYSEIYADLDSFKKDVEGVHEWVLSTTGIDTRYYRFPGGSSNAVSSVPIADCIAYLHENGYEYFDWNSASCDAQDAYLTPDQLNENVMSYVRMNEGNSIVLMHDLDEHYNTIEALPALIETLLSEGYEICPIDENTKPVQHYVVD